MFHWSKEHKNKGRKVKAGNDTMAAIVQGQINADNYTALREFKKAVSAASSGDEQKYNNHLQRSEYYTKEGKKKLGDARAFTNRFKRSGK